MMLRPGNNKGRAPLSPGEVKEILAHYKGIIARFKTTDFAKIEGIGKPHQTGYADYLDAVQAAFCIIVGYNGGQRARQDWTRFTIYDFKVVRSAATERSGLWVLQSGQHKETRYKNGKLVRRSPYLIVDEGMNEGVIDFFEILVAGRNPDWPVGYVGDGQKPMPNTGIRLLLYPNHLASPTTKLRWKNCGKGENHVNFIEPVVKILQAAGAMAAGGSYSMGSLRTGNAHNLARAGFPESIRSAVLGHTRRTRRIDGVQLWPGMQRCHQHGGSGCSSALISHGSEI